MPRLMLLFVPIFAFAAAGCRSPYASDRLAAAGGVTGAGAGALIGNASGNPLAGALIGAGVGAVSGALIGDAVDEKAAANRAYIEQQLGRQMANAVTLPDVVAMTQSGLGDEVIVTHIRSHGLAQPVTAQDLIALKQQGVSDRVLAAMQEPPPARVVPVSQPVIIQERYIGPPPCYYRPYCGPRRCGPSVGWGVSISN